MTGQGDRRLLPPARTETRPTTTSVLLLAASSLALWFALLSDPAGDAHGAGRGRLLFAAVAALGTALLVVAAFDLRRRTRGLRIDAPGPALAVARESFALDAGVLNDAGAAEAVDLVLGVRVPGGSSRPAALLASVAPGAEERVLLRGPPLRRGRHPQGRLEVVTGGLLGILTRRLTFELSHDVLVLPRVGSLRRLDARRSAARQPAARSGGRRGDDQEFHGLRAWREGEGLRQVRWKPSARRGRLLVQEFRGEPLPPVHVVLDTAARGLSGALFETAVSVAATVIEHHLRHEHPVRATILGGTAECPPAGRGRAALLPALCALAEAAPSQRAVPGAARATPAVRAGDRTVVVGGARGEPGAWDAPANAVVFDVSDPALAEVYHPAMHGATSRLLAGVVHAAPRADETPRPATPEGEAALRVLGRVAVLVLFVVAAGAALVSARGTSGVLTLAALGAALFVISGAWSRLLRRRRRHERSADLAALWAAPLVAATAAVAADSALLALALPLSVALLAAGLSLQQSLAAAASAPPVLRDGVSSAEPAPGPRETSSRRLRAGLRAGLGVLAVALPLALLVLVLPRVRGDLGSPFPRERDGRGGSPGGGDATMVVDPSSSGRGGAGVGWDERRVLIEVAPSAGGRPAGHQGPIYLRGTILSAIDGTGAWAEDVDSLERVRDADDGATDGWCRLAGPPRAADALGLGVRQVVLEHALTGNCVAHVPPGVTAVEFPEVVAAREGVLLLARTRGLRHVDYRVESRHPARGPFPTDRSLAALRDPDALTVPEGHPVYEALADEARLVTLEVSTDLAKVRAVVRRLRQAYRYEQLDDHRTDMEALDAFLLRRRGACVQFAEAATLMLRALGVPTRVATGFLVREWDAERKLYLGRGRDYHAWIEVDFEGCGWVTFDPTPEAEDPDFGPANAPPPVLGEERRGLEALVRIVEEAVVAGVAAVRSNPWWLAVSALVLPVALLVLRGLVRGASRRRATAAAVGSADSTAWLDLLAALARRGHRRRRSQTALEFAAAVLAAEGEGAAAFCALTNRQQEARFGGRPLTPDDERAMAEFSAQLTKEDSRA